MASATSFYAALVVACIVVLAGSRLVGEMAVRLRMSAR
jgi:hypothetical protein